MQWRSRKARLAIVTALAALAAPVAALPAHTAPGAQEWSVTLGSATEIVGSGHHRYHYFPNAHFPVLDDGNGRWLMFWSGSSSYRSVADSPYPESHTVASPVGRVFGGNTAQRGGCGWDNGGSWLNSVFRLPDERLVGFYHAEDWWCPEQGVDENPGGIAYKSIAVTYSADNGRTWSPGKRIITAAEPKPSTPEWGGAGDMSMVWDFRTGRWLCYFSETVNGVSHLRMAMSTDRAGAPGTWRKWDGTSFATPGLGGDSVPIANLDTRRGANPSVHWNGYLDRWVMVYGGWDGNIYASDSADLLNWSPPRFVVGPSTADGKAWYPTIISDNGDTSARNHPRLYYADITAGSTSVRAMSVPLTFTLR